jgi:glycosyltransferase involved in cell wall biosynthesis
MIFQLKQLTKRIISALFYALIRRDKNRIKNFPKGINLIGYIQAEMGLGEVLRNLMAAIIESKAPFLIRKTKFQLKNRQENSNDFKQEDNCKYQINVIGINPDLLYRLPLWLKYEEWGQRFNIGYWFWELENFPKEWSYACSIIDEVWVNSDFVAHSVRQVHPNVFKIPFSIGFTDPPHYLNRDYFGLSKSGKLFLFSYDFNSSAARKNPEGVICAFKKAFTSEIDDAFLIIKSINGDNNIDRFKEIKKGLCDDSRIIWIDNYLTSDEMRGLISVIDCYVSLHRSEGLGLGMAEAMYLGKPVIATAYSGNLEFMNVENSFLVPYRMVPVEDGEYLYGRNQRWAEPDLDVAAKFMKNVYENPRLGSEIGLVASKYIKKYHSTEVSSKAILGRYEAITSLIN